MRRDYKNNIYLLRNCWGCRGGSVWLNAACAWLFCKELANEEPILAHISYIFSEVLIHNTGMLTGLSMAGASLWWISNRHRERAVFRVSTLTE